MIIQNGIRIKKYWQTKNIQKTSVVKEKGIKKRKRKSFTRNGRLMLELLLIFRIGLTVMAFKGEVIFYRRK